MRIIECDRCHKRIKGVGKVGSVCLDLQDVKTGDLDGNNEFEGWDICDECMQKIAKFVQMKPLPKAVIKKPISTDTKYSAITPEKIERIKQLSREGKTVKDIAAEVGCSEPTVRKYKAEVTPNEETESNSKSDAPD